MKALKFTILLILFCQLFYCSSTSSQPNDYLIDSTRLGNINLCKEIKELVGQFKSMKDTILEGDEEGVSWIGKKISLTPGEWILVEASWLDSTKICRISTNSKRYKTTNGYKIGDMVSKMKQNNENLSFYESYPGFGLKSKQMNFGFTIEAAYSEAFCKEIQSGQNMLNFQKFINDKATIQTIVISCECE
jgi:hypothetical protein